MSGAVASWRGNRRDHVATDPVESPVLTQTEYVKGLLFDTLSVDPEFIAM